MESIAKLKNCPLPARKMRLLADIVRNRSVEESLDILKLHPKKMYARLLEKLILSGIANWREKNEEMDVEEGDLFIKTIYVDDARMLKRIQPAPQGRAHRIRKRFSHITLVVASNQEPELEEVEATTEENTDNE